MHPKFTAAIPRFWAKVHKSKGCWEWTACKDWDGYGLIKIGGRMHRAPRVSYILTHGDIPEGFLVCHTCDNPACVRPVHLFLGTAKDNNSDCKAKGRTASGSRQWQNLYPDTRKTGDSHWTHEHPDKIARGERQGPSKLTEAVVRIIRTTHKEGRTIASLAREFHVGESTIRRVVQGTHWRHVT